MPRDPCPGCGYEGLRRVLDVPYCVTCGWAGHVPVKA